MLLLKHGSEELVMDIIESHRKIQMKQLEFIEKYLDLFKELYKFEIALNGQISQTDLLLNEILNRIDDFDDEIILEEKNFLYERVLIKRYAQNILSNNTVFQNIFKSKSFDEMDERTSLFLERNKRILEDGKNIDKIIAFMDGTENESE